MRHTPNIVPQEDWPEICAEGLVQLKGLYMQKIARENSKNATAEAVTVIKGRIAETIFSMGDELKYEGHVPHVKAICFLREQESAIKKEAKQEILSARKKGDRALLRDYATSEPLEPWRRKVSIDLQP